MAKDEKDKLDGLEPLAWALGFMKFYELKLLQRAKKIAKAQREEKQRYRLFIKDVLHD